MLFDHTDFYTTVGFTLYKSLAKYYNEKLAEAISILEELVEKVTLKNLLHIEIELKLTLSFFYVKHKENQPAEELLKALYRKINKTGYQNARVFIKLLDLLLTSNKSKLTTAKINEVKQQFLLSNSGQNKILQFLQPEIDSITLYN